MKAAFFVLLALAGPLAAATFTVTNTNDAGAGSLRQAILDANAAAGHDAIAFSLGAGNHTIVLTTEALTIEDSLDIDGGGAVTISGGGSFIHFYIEQPATEVNLDNLTLRDGFPTGELNARGNVSSIFCDESILLTMTGCVVRDCGDPATVGENNPDSVLKCYGDFVLLDCTVRDNFGIAIVNPANISDPGSIVLERCIVANNTGTGAESSYSLEVADCLFLGNETGIYSSAGGSLDPLLLATNCTFVGNEYGIERRSSGSVQCYVTNCTFTDNDYGLFRSSSTLPQLYFQNCLVAGNTLADVSGEFRSLGNNLIGAGVADLEWFDSPGFVDGVNGDQVGTASSPIRPLLGELGNHGGPTPTIPLLAPSPAIDAGNDAAVTAPTFAGPPFLDQNGDPRIQGASVDIGAVEFQNVFIVDNASDAIPAPAGSLREKVALANAAGSGAIHFDQSVFTAPSNINLVDELSVTAADFAICGPADQRVTLDAGNTSRVIAIDPGLAEGLVGLKNLTIRNGDAGSSPGGGVRIDGSAEVLVECCEIRSNTTNSNGGGIFADSDARLFLRDSILRANTGVQGGGLYTNVTPIAIERCTFYNNDAGANGGGASIGRPDGHIRNSTISTNRAVERGGGLYIASSADLTISLEVTHCTVVDNTSDHGTASGPVLGGGGVYNSFNPIHAELQATAVAGNATGLVASPLEDIAGDVTSLGTNFIGFAPGNSDFSAARGDLVGDPQPLDPLLAPLDVAAAKVPFRAPLFGSPLVGAATPSALTALDQVGNPRLDGNRSDIGAIEFVRVVAEMDNGVENALYESAPSLTTTFEVERDGDLTGSAIVLIAIDPAESTATLADVELSIVGPGALNGNLVTIPDGIDTVEIAVAPIDDPLVEGTETIRLVVVDGAFTAAEPAADQRADAVSLVDNDWLVTNLDPSGPGSLRHALSSAQASGGAIAFDPALLGEAQTIPVPTPIVLGDATPSGLPAPTISIAGPDLNGAGLTLDAVELDAHFEVNDGVTLVLENLNLRRGGQSAVVLNNSSRLDARNCTFADNFNGGIGGAIRALGTSEVLLENCTLSGNEADGDGSAIAIGPNATGDLLHCTVTANTADADLDGNGAGAIRTANPAGILLTNSLVGDNFTNAIVDPVSDIEGVVVSGGGNVISDTEGLTWTPLASDKVRSNLWLGPLAMNGGPVFTHALLTESPALDAAIPSVLTSDARSFDRSTAGSGSGPDSGAYEQVYLAYQTYAEFAFPAGTPIPQRLSTADFDEDRLSNGLEFALGSDPADPGDIAGIALRLDRAASFLDFPLALWTNPATVGAEGSDDLTVFVVEAFAPRVLTDPIGNPLPPQAGLPAVPQAAFLGPEGVRGFGRVRFVEGGF